MCNTGEQSVFLIENFLPTFFSSTTVLGLKFFGMNSCTILGELGFYCLFYISIVSSPRQTNVDFVFYICVVIFDSEKKILYFSIIAQSVEETLARKQTMTKFCNIYSHSFLFKQNHRTKT